MTKRESSTSEIDTSSQQNVKLWSRDLVAISLLNLAAFIGFNMMVTGMPVYVATLGGSDVIVGMVTTCMTIAALLARPFAGLMLDHFGRKGILIATMAVMSVIIAAYAVFPIIAIILVLRFLQGFGWGLSSTAASTIAADSIPRSRFAEGMGYFSLTIALGTAFAPVVALLLLQSVGIVWMVAVAVGCTLVATILSIVLHVPEAPKQTEKVPLSLGAMFDKRAFLPAGIMLLLNFANGAMSTFIALYAQASNIDDVHLFFVVYAVATIICRPLVGRVIDRVGFFVPGILAALGVAASMVLVSFSTNIIMLCVAGAFAGVGFGTAMGTLQTMAVAAVPSQRRGVATSTYFFGFDAGLAIGAIVAGTLSHMLGYGTMYLVIAVFPLIAVLIFVLLGKKRIASYSE